MSDRLPADLKLLFDSISKKLDERIDPLESKVNTLFSDESVLPKHVEDVAKSPFPEKSDQKCPESRFLQSFLLVLSVTIFI